MKQKPPFSRSIALHIVLTLTIISNIFGSANAVRNLDAFLSAYPNLNNVLGYIYISTALLAVIGAFYLWSFRKAGLYIICIAFVTVIIIDLYAGIPIQHMFAACGLFVLILIVTIPVRKFLN